jgi:hypothetical protein
MGKKPKPCVAQQQETKQKLGGGDGSSASSRPNGNQAPGPRSIGAAATMRDAPIRKTSNAAIQGLGGETTHC